MEREDGKGYYKGSIIQRTPAEGSYEEKIVEELPRGDVTLNPRSVGKKFIVVRSEKTHKGPENFVVPVLIKKFNGRTIDVEDVDRPDGHTTDPYTVSLDPLDGVRVYPYNPSMISYFNDFLRIEFGPYKQEKKGGKKKRKSKRRKSNRRKNTMKTQKRK